jgi:hypothetical protein
MVTISYAPLGPQYGRCHAVSTLSARRCRLAQHDKRLPMGFGGSANIFQAQIMELMASLKFVQAYMDDLSIIMRGILDEDLQKMEAVLTRLRDAGLKVNAAKLLFCAHKIEYLGYILTRDGIKPQPKKVQAILALNPPNNVEELRHFLGMIQYYRDMWARRSEILSLT